MRRARVRIRRMVQADLPSVLELEALLFATPWSRESFEVEFTPGTNAVALVAEVGAELSGYMISWLIVDELHIGNLAVAPRLQGRGVAKAMLQRVISDAAAGGAVLASLEVRASNDAARALYEGLGFRPAAVRQRYYENNGEDAIVMILDVTPEDVRL